MASMIRLHRILMDGTILSLVVTLYIVLTAVINLRLWLKDYPPEIQAMVPPKTAAEKKLSLLFGIPLIAIFLGGLAVSTLVLRGQAPELPFTALFLNGFGVAMVFNLFDLLILDWLIFCALTPRFVVLPGTEGAAGYKNYYFHFVGFIKGTIFSAVAGLAAAAAVSLLAPSSVGVL